jgi:diacylglycerol kinase family enzyme
MSATMPRPEPALAAPPGSLPAFFHPHAGGGVEAAALVAAGERAGLRLAPMPCVDPWDAAACFAAWRTRAAPVWIAAGGDGTVARIAAAALDAGADLGVLPLGTRNHFARDAGIPLDVDAALAAIARGGTRRVDVGVVGDRRFLNNASLGLYTRFVLVREKEERRPGLKLWPALAKAAWHALRTSRDLEITLRIDDGTTSHRHTPVLLVGNNRYDLRGLDRGNRPRLDEGVLSVHVLHPRSRAGLAWFALRALVGAVSAPRDFDALATDALEVRSRAPELELALDGDVCRLPAPLRFSILPRALRVRVPLPTESA